MKETEIIKAKNMLYPQQIVLVTCTDKEGKPNVITLAWYMRTSTGPCMIAISVGKTKYSHQLLLENEEFILAVPNKDMAKETLYCGTHSGRDIDKIKETELKTEKAKFVKPPLLKDCIVNFECKIINKMETGDHTIFVGKVLAAYISEDKKELLFDFGNLEFRGI